MFFRLQKCKLLKSSLFLSKQFFSYIWFLVLSIDSRIIAFYIHKSLYWPDAPLGQSGLSNHFFPPSSSFSHTIANIFPTVKPILTKLCMSILLNHPHIFYNGHFRIRQRKSADINGFYF